jgi:DNA-binding XRE family transcriptional regulator
MTINEKIKTRRKELGLDPLEIAKLMNITDSSYYDIEGYEDEVYDVTNLKELKVLCSVLKLDPIDLLKFDKRLSKKVGSEKSRETCKSSRIELMKSARKKMGLSIRQFGSLVYLKDYAVIKLEKEPEYFEELGICQVDDCADAIDVPIEWLLYDRESNS